MPTYDYICKNKNCKHEWSFEQKITEQAIKTCPLCKKEAAQRLISGGTGFQLIGSGWAKEGYSSK